MYWNFPEDEDTTVTPTGSCRGRHGANALEVGCTPGSECVQFRTAIVKPPRMQSHFEHPNTPASGEWYQIQARIVTELAV